MTIDEKIAEATQRLRGLPEPYASKAIERINREDVSLYYTSPRRDAGSALYDVFTWSQTEEGMDFWEAVYSAFRGYKEYPEPPASWLPKQINGIDL